MRVTFRLLFVSSVTCEKVTQIFIVNVKVMHYFTSSLKQVI